MKKIIASLLLLISSYANASLGCSQDDLSGISFIKCAGYVEGNILNNSNASLSFVQSIFSDLGYQNLSTNWTEKLSNLNGTNTIDFKTTLSGINIIGIHKGGVGEGPQSTAFYVVDAGASLDSFKYNLSGSSNATIYSIGPVSPIPEPGTGIMFAAGLCLAAWLGHRKGRVNK